MTKALADRRSFLRVALAVAAGFALMPLVAVAAQTIRKLVLSATEWKARLTPEQYRILREEGTEAPFTSPLNHEKRNGVFACVGCQLELFSSDKKFDSGTGWPSFFEAMAGRIETKTDRSLLMERTEYHCARCGGHHGHLFNDGPQPTGLRYCNNGVALIFIPAKAIDDE